MTRRKKVLIGLGCGLFLVGAMITAIAANHLLANREAVRTLITTKAAQATGGSLNYQRLSLGFLPMPHLQAEGIQLERPGAFAITARELEFYPAILPLLTGRLRIRHLVLREPNIQATITPGEAGDPADPAVAGNGHRSFHEVLPQAIRALFKALERVDNGTQVHIDRGRVKLQVPHATDLDFSQIDASGKSAGDHLAVHLTCRSPLTGQLDLSLEASAARQRASGTIAMTALDLLPIMEYLPASAGITSEATSAGLKASFRLNGPTDATARFRFRFPKLTILRNNGKLALDKTDISGRVHYRDRQLALTLDPFRSAQPPLHLTASVTVDSGEIGSRPALSIHAAAEKLDIAVAADVSRAIAGDLSGIRTAFDVARQGLLRRVSYDLRLVPAAEGYRTASQQAQGYLEQGRVTIPGIDTDLERLSGQIRYQDDHLDVSGLAGHIRGASFTGLHALLDWSGKSTLSLSSTDVQVEMKPLSNWLLGFGGLSAARELIQSVQGRAQLTTLQIDGPLTDPAQWDFTIAGTPEALRIATSKLPFPVQLSGGKIVYIPGKEQASRVAVAFLDTSLVASYQSEGIIQPQSIQCQLDGTLGPESVAWLTGLLPIPDALQIKPPVELSGIHLAWSQPGTIHLTGSLTTAGDVSLFADATVGPQNWHVRRIQFSDGNSQALAAAQRDAEALTVSFSGRLEKATADRILKENHILSGHLEGDCRIAIDPQHLSASTFTGRLSGNGVQVHGLVPQPIVLPHFSLQGSGRQIEILSSKMTLGESRMAVSGKLERRLAGLFVDLDVDAKRLEKGLFDAMGKMGGQKKAEDPAHRATALSGNIRLASEKVSYGRWNWSPVEADVRLDAGQVRVRLHKANLCGIETIGEFVYTDQGLGMQLTPHAQAVDLQAAATCLLTTPVQADARFDLSGEIALAPTPKNPLAKMTGKFAFLSEKGRIDHANVLMRIFSVLNLTEVFTGGQSDLTEKGYGYSRAYAAAEIGDGKVVFNEILLDGNSLKLTGQGSIDLTDATVDIMLLAAPLKTVDRIVDKLPIINYITGGSLISIPLHLIGPVDNIKVVPMSASSVGQGLLNVMQRTLKAPFKLVETVSNQTTPPPKQP